MINRIIQTIREHIIAEEALAGGGVGVGVYEAAGGGVVVAGLEIIEPGILDRVIALRAKNTAF